MMYQVEDHGSIALVRPLDDECRDWISEHVQDDALWFGGALVVEPRFLEDLVAGMEGV